MEEQLIMDIIFRFEKNSDFNKLALRLMLLVIIYTAFAVYMIGYYYPRKNGWDIYYMVGTIVIVFLASIELVSKTIDIFINSRTVTIDKNGLNITLHKTYNYAWNDLKTV